MKLLVISLLIFIFSAPAISKADVQQPIKVKISFMEALAPKDTTSSERFQKEYEYAVQTGKDLTREKLKSCGYEFIEEKVLYDASDNLQAFEQAKKSEAAGSWLIVGPRRSNHYLLAVKGAPETPSVSIMASAKEVFQLNSMHLSLAQSNQQMAKVLAREVQKKFKTKAKYFSIVSEDCVSCVDFAASFDVEAKKLNLKSKHQLYFSGEQPNIEDLEKTFLKEKPDFVLIPNYSMVSAYLMGIISKWNPKVFFIGGDGWGDAKYGFVHDSPQLSKVNGMTVKGMPPVNKGLEFFDLGKEILKNPSLASAFPASGSAQALLKVIQDVSEILCKYKPKDKKEFTASFKDNGSKYFKNPWGVSVYKLFEGEIIFDKTVN
ncbi:MAG: hypothetical protein A2622_13780 [Bdellovibrionales bacterium RIFCSPHIGHO2_01_FULL_40_29]|nr:MAG: hypothetical protein A2622_13780 [Bdellovibrionales bacterium RIFCSPHIGHO2_01_FULL_40_29]OFZ35221.1 MAG: hypothetical protein A3D17_14430 [Bdellovibrionales bacterium RIFCSPHIGHO2_02_FULL_40_15]